jgi:hypothetical protein
MRIIGCDLHARQQAVAMLDSETGELMEMTLTHEGNNVREFYSRLPRPVRVGIEATGSMQWFVNLMEELGIECLVGHPAEIRLRSLLNENAHPVKRLPGTTSQLQYGHCRVVMLRIKYPICVSFLEGKARGQHTFLGGFRAGKSCHSVWFDSFRLRRWFLLFDNASQKYLGDIITGQRPDLGSESNTGVHRICLKRLQ